MADLLGLSGRLGMFSDAGEFHISDRSVHTRAGNPETGSQKMIDRKMVEGRSTAIQFVRMRRGRRLTIHLHL